MKELKTMKTDDTEERLKELAIQRNIELGQMDLSKVDKDEFMKELFRAKQLGVFLRDREMSRRIEGGQVIRVINLISTDTEERKQYIEFSMPQIAQKIMK